jgi:hypothetical protein
LLSSASSGTGGRGTTSGDARWQGWFARQGRIVLVALLASSSAQAVAFGDKGIAICFPTIQPT